MSPMMMTMSIRYPRKETIFFSIRDPNAIITRPTMISMWPVDEW